jgi:H+/Cl- antiporter ClcA
MSRLAYCAWAVAAMAVITATALAVNVLPHAHLPADIVTVPDATEHCDPYARWRPFAIAMVLLAAAMLVVRRWRG